LLRWLELAALQGRIPLPNRCYQRGKEDCKRSSWKDRRTSFDVLRKAWLHLFKEARNSA
jgi:hypothetical protein